MAKKRPTLDLEALFNGTLKLEDVGHDDLVPARLIKPTSPKWYWRHRIVQDDLNILAGTQGLGKSQVATAIAAEATQRGESVIILSAEDSPETTIVPRLISAGAVLSSPEQGDLVHIWRQGAEWSLEDFKKLQEYVFSVEASLVIIDPVAAYVTAKTDTYKDAHVRNLLAPLRAIAADQECTNLAVMHLKKGLESEAVNSVGGSVAWTAAPRSVLMVRRLEEDKTARVLYHAKCNVGPEQPALLFEIVPVDFGELGSWASSTVSWGAEDASLDLSASFAVEVEDRRRSKPSPALDEAIRWLKDRLGDGEWQSTGDLNAAAAEDGLKTGTRDAAKKKLGLEYKDGNTMVRWPAAGAAEKS
jgi:hypothetical protein